MNDEQQQPPDANDAATSGGEHDKAELETLRNENEELRRAIRLREARDQMVGELAKSGARSPELLFSAVLGDIRFDDRGQPSNLSALAADLKRSFPEQFETVSPPASIDAAAGSGHSAGPLTAEALQRMSPAEIRELDWAEVRVALANGR